MKEKGERQTGKQAANKVKRSNSRYGDINICMCRKILISQQCITTSGKCAFGWCSNAARISSKLSLENIAASTQADYIYCSSTDLPKACHTAMLCKMHNRIPTKPSWHLSLSHGLEKRLQSEALDKNTPSEII